MKCSACGRTTITTTSSGMCSYCQEIASLKIQLQELERVADFRLLHLRRANHEKFLLRRQLQLERQVGDEIYADLQDTQTERDTLWDMLSEVVTKLQQEFSEHELIERIEDVLIDMFTNNEEEE